MIKIVFGCLGNICRSPMAEFVFKDMVRKNGLEKEFYIESCATSSEEVGNDVHYGTVRKLNSMGIPVEHRGARQMTKDDYNKFDYIIGMEERNIQNILRIVGQDKENKICKLLDFSNNPRDIADPWYTGNFDKTYDDILEGCNFLLEKIRNEKSF